MGATGLMAGCRICGCQFDPFDEACGDDDDRCPACVEAPEPCHDCGREPTRDPDTGEWRDPACHGCS